jgi:hypothetical protein
MTPVAFLTIVPGNFRKYSSAIPDVDHIGVSAPRFCRFAAEMNEVFVVMFS